MQKKRTLRKKIKSYDRKEKKMPLVSGQTLSLFYWNGGVRVSVKTMCIGV